MYAWIVTLMLHLLPILMVWVTWKSPWNIALEKIVRVQIMGSLIYLLVYPIVKVVSGPDFQLAHFDIGSIVLIWHDDGSWSLYKILSAEVLTAVCAAIRRKVKPQ